MFFKKKPKLNLSKPSQGVFKYKREALGVFFIFLFIILILSLFSYYPKDNSLFYYSSDKAPVQNWIGSLGANAAALFFYLFGSPAYISILILCFLGYIILYRKGIKEEWDRIVALVLLLVSFSALFYTFSLDFTNSFPGGLLGSCLYKILFPLFGSVGTGILLFAFVWIGIVMFFRVSICKAIKKSAIIAFRVVKSLVISFFSLIWNFIRSLFSSKKNGKKSGGKKGFFGGKADVKKDENCDAKSKDDFWQSMQNLAQNVAHETKEVFVLSHDKQVGKLSFLYLPNSCVTKNFLSDAEFLQKLSSYVTLEHTPVPKKSKRSRIEISYELPDVHMFGQADSFTTHSKDSEEECKLRAEKLEEKLSYFGIQGKVTAIRPGPVITLFEYKPEIGSKISKIMALEDDLAMALQAVSIRIVAPIPGRSVVGFEISNQKRLSVHLSDVFLKKKYKKFSGRLPLALGVDIVGNPVVQDLVSMPHLLVAGSTGSGKSVGLNAMLVSLLCKMRPDQLKLILIDPKRLEFAPWADIPHLLFPIVTNPRKAAPILKWLVQQMEERYDKMAQAGVRNIVEYQKLYEQDSDEYENMPFIVLMIDELADLMMVAGKEVETQIARIAQMARAAGIHMIVATQRPSVDVVTGLIKVNFPSRLAYRVSSKIDSRTIIDCQGAEKLLGKGDLLYMNSASSDLQRVHGAFVSDSDIEHVTTHLKSQEEPQYLDLNETLRQMTKDELEKFEDDLYPEIVEFLRDKDEISISMLQRYYRIGFNRSAKIIERLEMDGIIAPAQGSKPRKVLLEK